MAYSIMDYGYCMKCGDDDNVIYCKAHQSYLCQKCDSGLHESEFEW